MGEIKYRAWDKKNKRMSKPFYLYEIHSNGLVNPSGGELFDLQECEIIQYTGLKDSQNREIYEGDVVYLKVWQGIDKGYGLEQFIIKWQKESARFEIVDIDDNFWGFDTSNEIEVIGNIFENLELLENSNE